MKADAEGRGRRTAGLNLKKALKEVRRIAKAEKIQEKITAKKMAITERAKIKGDTRIIERAKSEEEKALAVLWRIREDKRGAERTERCFSRIER